MDPWSLSVLMTTYDRTQPQHLALALDSVFGQSRPADRVVLVADGPLTAEQDAVIAERAATHPELDVVRLAANVGSGLASAAGLERIATRWVARMDSDDIAWPERFERQLARLSAAAAAGEPLAALGAAMIEFDSDAAGDAPDPGAYALGLRRLPSTPRELRRYVTINSPINNPTAILDVAAVRAVGGYRHVPFMEDYDLYARLVGAGYAIANLEEPLLWFRASMAMLRRRGGRRLLAAEWQMQQNLVSYGLISRPRAVVNFAARSTFRLLPSSLLTRAYRALFRRAAPTRG